MPRYDYRCTVGHVSELIRPIAMDTVECPTCGRPADRQSIYAISQGSLVHVPAAQRPLHVGEFEEASQELAYQHAQLTEQTDGAHQMPDYVQEAKQRAWDALAGRAPIPKGWTDPHGTHTPV